MLLRRRLLRRLLRRPLLLSLSRSPAPLRRASPAHRLLGRLGAAEL
jgi:hypothetical protein